MTVVKLPRIRKWRVPVIIKILKPELAPHCLDPKPLNCERYPKPQLLAEKGPE